MSDFDSVCVMALQPKQESIGQRENSVLLMGVGGGGGSKGEVKKSILRTLKSVDSMLFFIQGGFGKTGCGFLNFSLFSWRGMTISLCGARSHVYSYILCDPVNLNSGIFLDSINVICSVNSFKPLSMTLS